MNIYAKKAVTHTLLAGLLILGGSAAADQTAERETELQKQRAEFNEARSALKQGRITSYKKLAANLESYPLHPYLEYWALNRNLSPAKRKSVDQFLEQNNDTVLAERLRNKWLTTLARKGHWSDYLEYYQTSSNATLNCYHRRALYKTGAKEEAMDNIESLWLVGKSQPRACDPLFATWRENGGLTADLAWQRIELAMDNKQVYLARYLERFLPTERRKWAEQWRNIHRHPQNIFNNPKLKPDTELTQKIIAHGIRRMALRQPIKAAEAWDKLVMDYSFSEEEQLRTESGIALALARHDAPEAMHWLSNITDNSNEAVRTQRVMTSINQDEWEDALFWMDQLQAEERQEERWRYWRARALEAAGRPEQAYPIYNALAQERDYYGFLAADRIEAEYAFEDRPLTYDEAALAEITNMPAVARAYELYVLGDILNARREWYHTTTRLNEEELLKASQLAHQWKWHDRAIFTMGRTSYRDDLSLRFPLLHSKQITQNAAIQKVDPSWAYAVIRQESAFMSDARSPAGAMGLMQIMPRTGKSIARDLDTRLNDTNQLLEVDTNIRFGISYLRKVMNRFDQNTVLATAAYNAGSQRVKGWLPEETIIEADRWVENVPFKETRNYLKNVLTYSVIYDQRMGRSITPLRMRMPTIGDETPSPRS